MSMTTMPIALIIIRNHVHAISNKYCQILLSVYHYGNEIKILVNIWYVDNTDFSKQPRDTYSYIEMTNIELVFCHFKIYL